MTTPVYARRVRLAIPSKALGVAAILLAFAVLVGAWGPLSAVRATNNRIVAGIEEQRCRADAAVDSNLAAVEVEFAKAQEQITLAELVSAFVQRTGQVGILSHQLDADTEIYKTAVLALRKAVEQQKVALVACRRT